MTTLKRLFSSYFIVGRHVDIRWLLQSRLRGARVRWESGKAIPVKANTVRQLPGAVDASGVWDKATQPPLWAAAVSCTQCCRTQYNECLQIENSCRTCSCWPRACARQDCRCTVALDGGGRIHFNVITTELSGTLQSHSQLFAPPALNAKLTLMPSISQHKK